MFELGKSEDGIAFYKLEHAFELDKFTIGEFTYFRKYLGMSDYLSNFQSWLKRPTVVLVVAVKDNTVLGWSMNEKWSSPAKDSRPTYVLRGIEVSPKLARTGMGKKIFCFISGILVGHIITKPVNKIAKLFFESLDFVEPTHNSPVDLGNYPGYLILEESRKHVVACEGIIPYEDNVKACRHKLFPKEAVSDSLINMKKEPEASDSDSPVEGSGHVTTSVPGDKPPEDISSPVDFEGKFLGEQKMMSPCKCGNFLVNKYMVTGKRSGTAFICTNCNVERYFLPMKKK
ncbi:MAG: hypothetical protein PWQ51_452 [Methanolobus sp.]|jgi:hypothetical protein|uniref:N-acetyltransferase domain-containing protein n=1 Tax=Methanolobus tindarius DSM 2278 TaxID=1090322 RepID=W9DNX8_METTI|nr:MULTISPECIES: hypothetical protein [Methanolobus]ETA66725.1 hypothetical protein MettiDRAFT_0125 [Methanolobus tindarius DSM 2278]MDK2832256.1 hypothetical protein [Methanolobus sp.]MDK2938288.1 hypothetical protein [Methanolobus sp.]